MSLTATYAGPSRLRARTLLIALGVVLAAAGLSLVLGPASVDPWGAITRPDRIEDFFVSIAISIYPDFHDLYSIKVA